MTGAAHLQNLDAVTTSRCANHSVDWFEMIGNLNARLLNNNLSHCRAGQIIISINCRNGQKPIVSVRTWALERMFFMCPGDESVSGCIGFGRSDANEMCMEGTSGHPSQVDDNGCGCFGEKLATGASASA